ncbi:RluA family pseudouridine synthase [Patescibacteria group bacterium]
MKNKVEIVFENNNYLVINKPAGLLVHGAGHIKEPSLIDELEKKYPEITKVGEDPNRPGIIHRLDKLVSGLMVIARSQEAFENLKQQFQKRTIKKYYTALVFGKIIADEGEINFPIDRSPKGHKMMALAPTVKGETNPQGKAAITKYIVKKRFINYTLLKLRIITGRTHQIRVHLAAFGHPVVGDDLYGNKKAKSKNQKLETKRIFLVADELEFMSLDGQEKKFSIKLPHELNNFLENYAK